MMMLEYFLTNSKYLWLKRSCSQCCEDALLEETWKDLSYFPGGLWPKIITCKKKGGQKVSRVENYL